ncbi:MAG TPA: tetratricopeptide repeat protein [Bacteroidota bacterium]
MCILLFSTLLALGNAFTQDTKENADFKLAVNLYNDKLYDLALEQFQQFIARYPNSQQTVEGKFYLGLTQTKLGKHEDARFTFQNFALSYPDNPKAPEAWWNVAEAYAAQNNHREAAVSFERIKVFHPKSKLAASGLLLASKYYETAGDKANSEKMLRALLQDYPASDDALTARILLSELSLAANQFEAARAESQRVLSNSKDPGMRASAQLILAKAHMGLSRFSDAEKTLDEIVKDPRSSAYYEALFMKGVVKRQAGNLEDAVAVWRTIEVDSVRATSQYLQLALLEIGESFAAARNFTGALPYFERAAATRAQRQGEALYKAAIAAEKTKQWKKAGEYYTRALRVETERTEQLKNLREYFDREANAGKYFDRRVGMSVASLERAPLLVGAFKGATFTQQYHEALRLASQFRSEYPQDRLTPRILYEAARIAQHELKDPRQAIELYQSIVTEYASSGVADEALFGFGTALAQSGSSEEALLTFQNFKERFPGSEFIPKAEDEAQRIRLFTVKSRESGIEKLALLIGDVIAQKSKGDLSFRLAEIYFYDLKDYERAAQHFELALDADLDAAKRPAARYSLAQAYDLLAWKAALDSKDNKHYATEAMKNYELLLRAFPLNEFRDEAVASLNTLKLQNAATLTEVRALQNAFVQHYPALEKRDAVMIRFGEAYRRFDGDADAIEVYRSLVHAGKGAEAAEAKFQLALTLRDIGKDDSTYTLLQEFVTAYPQHPRSAEAAWIAGQLAAKQTLATQAVHYFDMIERQYPYSAYAGRLAQARAEAYFAADDIPSALEHFQRYLNDVAADHYSLPDVSQRVQYSVAQCYQRVGRRAEAKKYYAEALAHDASSPVAGEIYFALASIAREERNLELAAHYLQRAGRLSAGGADLRLRASLEAADLLFRGEVYTDAVERYRDVLTVATSDSVKQNAQARIVVCYFRMNNAEEADRSLAGFLKTYPKAMNEIAEFEFERGRYLLRRDEFDRAKIVLENVIKKYEKAPVAIDAQYWLGRVVEAVGRTQEARKTYETIIERFPNHTIAPRARLSLGNIFYAAEQWEPAVQQYKALLDNEQAAPDLVPFAMNNIILAYKELGLYDGALELTRKYLERFPADPNLLAKRIDLGVLYQKLGYYDQSVLHLQGLLENADPDTEAELRYYIGEAHYYKGAYQQAILEFLKVPYLVTRRTNIDWVATSFYMAGQSYEKMSKFDQAISMYQQIIERPNIDAQFKAAAQKEIDRVNALVRSQR